MKLIRFLQNDATWYPLYFKEIKNRLRKDRNLADLTDVEAARKNIGLGTGDVCTETEGHTHVQYVTSTQMKAYVDTVVNTTVQTKIDEVNDLVSSLNTLIENLRTAMTQCITSDMIVVSDGEPLNKKEGMLWFCTAPGQNCIQTYHDNNWVKTGAIWV